MKSSKSRKGKSTYLQFNYLLLPLCVLLLGWLSSSSLYAQASFDVAQTHPFSLSATRYSLSNPSFGDLDGDGDYDIVVGATYGSFYYYENIGSSSNPEFVGRITNPFSLTAVGRDASPQLFDLDGDNDLDLLVGDYDGVFQYFENIGSSTAPQFATVSVNPFSLTGIGNEAKPALADLDMDGDADLLALEINGGFLFFENIGTSSVPLFDVAVSNPFSLSTVPSAYSKPTFVDLDNDGDFDLMVGRGDGSFQYHENIGSTTVPLFGAAQIDPFSLVDLGNYATTTFSDLDNDGDLDLLSGDFGGKLIYYENLILPATIVWDGETSTDWHIATNWEGDVLPTSVNPVLIPNKGRSGKYPVITTDVEIRNLEIVAINATVLVSTNSLKVERAVTLEGGLTINSGASFLPMGSITGSGVATIHRNTTFGVNDGQYSVIGSPITSGTTGSLGSVLYSYDETVPYGVNGNSRFSEVTGPTTMTPGDAYFSANTGNIFFQGTPNAGSINTPLIYDETRDGGSANAGFNLVSNPYPSAIGYSDFVSANADIDGTIYLWDDGGSDLGQRANADYITVTSMGATGGSSRSGSWDGHMRSCQGFFVKATTAGTLIFDPSMMQTSNNTDAGFFRKESPSIPKLRLSLTSEEGYSDILLGFAEEATSGFDRTLDAYNVKGNSTLQLYSRMDASILAIQALAPLQSETTIDLGFDTDRVGQHTISIENASMEADVAIMLIDRELDKEVNLSQTKNYSFSSTAVDNSSRFQLLFTKHDVLSLDENLDKPHLIVYADENAVYLKTDAQLTQAHVSIYTIGGNLLSRSHAAFYEGKASFPFSHRGLFIVRLESENGIITQKFFH